MTKKTGFNEFLLTYGWAILVVFACIGALAYFGVLTPDMFKLKMDSSQVCYNETHDCLVSGYIKIQTEKGPVNLAIEPRDETFCYRVDKPQININILDEEYEVTHVIERSRQETTLVCEVEQDGSTGENS